MAPRKTAAAEPQEAVLDSTLVREPARVSFSYERTFQAGQFQPVKVAAWISVSAGASDEEVAEAIQTYEAVGAAAVESLDARFEEIRERLGESAPAPKATRSNSSAPSQKVSTTSPSTSGRPAPRSSGNEYEDIEVAGRSLRVRNYINQRGEPSISVQCDVEGCKGANGKPGRATFSERTAANGHTYSALDNLEQAVKFKGGVFCFNHREHQPKPQARKPVALTFDDDDGNEPF